MKRKYLLLTMILFVFLFLFSTPSLALIPGDFNGDNVVDFEDLMIYAMAYGSCEGDINWNPACDLNGDGCIEFEDLMIFAMHYGEVQAAATAPSNIVLAVGSTNPVGGVTNVAIPDAGGTDTTGAVTGWVATTADKIKFTVTDTGEAVSTIEINTFPYTSEADYTIAAASDLTIVVTTTETDKVTGVRTFTVTVAAPVQATPTFNPPAGAVAFPTTVTIISADAEDIYYTTDGLDPTISSTNQATTPLTIDTACTVKALAVKAGYTNSAIGSAVYTQAATADLSGLALSGSPGNYTFVSGTYTYNSVTVANAVDSITVTPTGAGEIKVDGITVTSGSASGAITLTAGVEKTITVVATETGKSAKTYAIKVTRTALAVGDSYGGGKVAYIFQSGDLGYVTGEQHGLIAAEADATELMAWSNIYDILLGGTEWSIGYGQANTTLIVNQGCWIGAAYYCDNLSEGGYDDWFLPSFYELWEILLNKDAIGGFNSFEYHWTSSEYDTNYAYCLHNYETFISYIYEPKNWTKRVRAVRYF